MDKIKFRAWLKREKIMVRVMEINFPEHYITAHDERGGFYSKRGLGCVIMMQFTGLKDKNGKEIYEGDIVRTADGSLIATIKMGECCPPPVKRFCEFHGIETHKIYCLHAYDKNGEYLIEDNKSLEIIGNIYEDGHLLKKIKERDYFSFSLRKSLV